MIEYSFKTFKSDFFQCVSLLDMSCSDDEIQAYNAKSSLIVCLLWLCTSI